MNKIHQKTHFKAAISISRGDACCVKVHKNEFGDQYAEIARNIDLLNRSTKKIPSEASKGGKISEWLSRNRNTKSQGRQRNIKAKNDSQIDFTMIYDGQSQSDQNTQRIDDKNVRGRAASLPPTKNDIAVQDWSKMTEEEKQAF